MEIDFDKEIFEQFAKFKGPKNTKNIFEKVEGDSLDNHPTSNRRGNKIKYGTTRNPDILQDMTSKAKKIDSASTDRTYLNENRTTIHIIIVVAVAAGLLALAAGLVLHRKKKHRQLKTEEEFSILHKRKNSNLIDPAFYNYVCPQQPIDFVVPLPPSPNLSMLNLAAQPIASDTNWAELSYQDSGPPPTLLGGLNPDLYVDSLESCPEEYDFPEGHRGRIFFNLNYNVELERLSLHLVKIKNLPSRVYGSLSCCDSFVRIYLVPDERRYLQSKVRKKNCNPFFDETFVFQLPSRSINERLVKVSVFDNDRGKHHNIIGHVMLPLTDLNTSTTPIIQWRDLEKEEEIKVPCCLGEMMVSLCYNQNLERLIVTVCEARKLEPPKGCQALDTYVKLIFMKDNKVAKTKKTMVVRNSTDPKYNESFHFKMAQGSVNSCNLLLQVTQSGVKQKDKHLGRLVLGPYMFSRGKSLEHWNEAISAGHKQIRYWHKLTS